MVQATKSSFVVEVYLKNKPKLSDILFTIYIDIFPKIRI